MSARPLILLAACVLSGRLAGQAPGQDGYFHSRSARVPIRVVPDSLAVVVRDGVSDQQLAATLGRLELRIARRPPGNNIVIVSSLRRLQRQQAVNVARQIRQVGADLLTNAGVMVVAEGSREPVFVSDEILVQFDSGVSASQVQTTLSRYGVEVIPRPYLNPNQFVVRLVADSLRDALTTANQLHDDPLTQYAQPNFIRIVVPRRSPPSGNAPPVQPVIPNDRLFASQWHLNNTGQGGGTVDADIDAPEAWDLTLGSANVIIAVIDDGFDMTHADLTPNMWVNAGEVAGNGVDDDGNGFIDDINGWDFQGNDANPGAATNHGTSTAGAAAARGNNTIGVSGSCPNCRIMFIRYGSTFADDVAAFNYVQQNGADVVTNSWGYALGAGTGAVQTAINNAGAVAVVLFAMNTTGAGYREDCLGASPDISSLANVIAVAASSNADARTPSGYGNCMELMGPTDDIGAVQGTLWAVTTDRQGTAGYNNLSPLAGCPTAEPGTPPADARDYTFCFGGTSFATPVIAGIAGLLLTARPALTPAQVRQLLDDTADRIEDGVAQYDQVDGFSRPTTAPTAGLPVGSTHGYGRGNAFEAVRVVAPAADGGRGGVDVFLRDNRLDWGNTERPSNTNFEPTRGFIGHWRSMDIKVDAPPYQTAPTAATFNAFTDETPSAVAGDMNRVYVRVRNRGPVSAGPVTVKLHWTQFGTALPPLPADFWTAFPANSADPTNEWSAMQCTAGGTSCSVATLGYSGSSVAGTAGDVAQIVQFDFPAPPVDPARPNHFCLLGMVDAPGDRILPLSRTTQASDFVVDWLTPRDNNTTHRNYQNLVTTRSSRFYVRNPLRVPIRARLQLEAADERWNMRLDTLGFGREFQLAAGQRILVTAEAAGPREGGEVSILQVRTDTTPPTVMGGLTLAVASRAAKVGLSVHAGTAVPTGTLATTTNVGPTANLDLVVQLSPRLAADARVGYSRFAGSGGAPDVTIWDLSANLRFAPVPSNPMLFLNGGGGAYHLQSGDWEAGFNLGIGVRRVIGPAIEAEATANYHQTLTAPSDVGWVKVQLGLVWFW